MRFVKMHGAGNDYIYIDARNADEDWSSLAQQMSDRHFGIGSDGLILLRTSNIADIAMQMFNADGSEAEMCGNGIRCLVKFALDRNLIPHSGERQLSKLAKEEDPIIAPIRVETLKTVLGVTPITENGRIIGARVSMGKPLMEPSEIPVNVVNDSPNMPIIDYPIQVENTMVKLTFVSMGNPHAIAFTKKDVNSFPLEVIGPMIENHPLFPNRMNFEIVNILDSTSLAMRVWERGSGETLACGTGAAAATVAAHIKGMIGNNINIMLPGGTLRTEWDGYGEVYLEGPAEEIFEGEWRKNI